MNVLDAAHLVVHQYPGGAASLAPRMGKSAVALSHEVKGTDRAKLGLLDAVLATELTGDLRILLAWATAAGQMLVPLPEPSAVPGNECMLRLADSAREFGELVREVSDDLGDGIISDNELVRINKDCVLLVASIREMQAALLARNLAGKPAGLAD